MTAGNKFLKQIKQIHYFFDLNKVDQMSYINPNHQYKYSRSVSRNHQNQAKILEQSNFMANYFNLPFVSKRKPQDHETIVSPIIRLKNYNVLRDSEANNDDQPQKYHRLPQESLQQQRDEYDDSHILSKRKNNRIMNSCERENVSLRSKTTRVRKQMNTAETIDYETSNISRNYDHGIKQLRSKTLATNDSVKNISKTDTMRTEQADHRLFDILQRSLMMEKRTPNLKKASTILQGSYPFNEMEIQYHNRRRYLEVKKSSYERLKIVFLFVQAAMRISRKFRKTKKEIQREQLAIQSMIDQHQQYVNNFRQQDIKFQQRKFVNIVSSKIIHCFESKKYFEECLFIWQKEENQMIKDIRRIRFCGFSMMFMKNLEFLTRSEYLPALISHQINLSLFNSKNKNISQFVINRCKFYLKKVTKLTINEKLLIGAEYFFFEVIIPNLLDLGNELETDNLSLKNQTQYYIVGIISLLQTLFTNYFQKISMITQTKFFSRQKKLKVSIDKKTGHMSIKIETSSILDDDENKLLQGCFNKEVMQEIFDNKIKWTGEINNLFEIVLQNLGKQIKV